MARLETPKHVHCPGAAPGERVGETKLIVVEPGEYELRCSAPVRVRSGQTEVTPTDVLVDPSAPLTTQLLAGVAVAAATSAGAQVHVLRVR